MTNVKYWRSVSDDSLKRIGDVTTFLHEEFTQAGADQLWSEEYFRWKLGDSNPAGNGYLSYALFDNKIVGTASLTKKRAIYNGEECLVGEVGDTYTSSSIIRRGQSEKLSNLEPDPKHYVNKSIFGRLISETTNRAIQDGVSIIYGTPNKNSFPGYTKRLNFLEFKNYDNTTYYRPSGRLLMNEYPLLRIVEFIIRPLEQVLISMQNLLYKKILGIGIDFSIETPKKKEIDELWYRVKPDIGFSLIRDFQYWNHRFVDHPLAEYQFFSFYRNGVLIAIVVARIFSSREDKKALSLVEWMADKSVSLSYLFSEVINYFKKSDIDHYYLWVPNKGHKAIAAKNNIFLLKRSAPIIFFDNKAAREICSSNRFDFYLGSSDAI